MVNIRKRLIRLLAKDPDPVSRVVPGRDEKNPFARNGRDDNATRRKKVERWIRMYERGGPVADAIDAYALFALTNGYDLVCESGAERLKEQVQAWFDQPWVDMDQIFADGILSAVLAGDAYQEIIPTRTGQGVWGIVSRDPSTFSKNCDEYGRVISYSQFVPGRTGFTDEEIQIEPDRMLSFSLFHIPGQIYGLSLMDRAEDDINRDCDTIESITKAIHRHGTPKNQWAIGSDEHRATAADLEDVEKQIEKQDAKTDYVTHHDVVIKPLDVSGIQNADTYSNIMLQRVACALGVPEEMLGLGRGSTEATATVRMKVFMDKISTIQQRVARAYNRQLIDRITGRPGAVWIQFRDVSPEDEAAKAAWIAQIMQATPLDQFSVLPQAWVREQFGIDEAQYDSEENYPVPAEQAGSDTGQPAGQLV